MRIDLKPRIDKYLRGFFMGAAQQQQLELFKDRLPTKPWSTNDLQFGLHITSRVKAIQQRYIQHNGPTHRFWLAFDIDRAGGGVDWDERLAPAPNISVMNPENGHAHLLYGLEISIRTAADARGAPLRFAAAVEAGLREKLDADAGYAGLIVKNPLHADWRVITSPRPLYSLPELAEWVDLSGFNDKRKKLPEVGLGRNSSLFEGLRQWSYKAIRQGWPGFDQWMAAVEQRAEGLNLQFETPLDANECRHVAKSVGKWTYQHFDASGFSRWQAQQGRRGGLAKGEAYAEKAALAAVLADKGMSARAIAKELGCSPQSVLNWVSK